MSGPPSPLSAGARGVLLMIAMNLGQTWQLEKCPQFEGASTPRPSTEMSCLACRAHDLIDKRHQKEMPVLDPAVGLTSCMHAGAGPLPLPWPKRAPSSVE